MQGDALHAEQGAVSWPARVRALSQRSARLQAIRDQAVQDLDSRCQEIADLATRIEVLTKVGELFRALMDRLVLKHVHSVESVVTEGLRTIFFDQDLTFEAEVGQRYNRICIDFFIKQHRSGGRFMVRGHPLDSFGGGPSSIASLVLRLLALMKLKRWPILLLDETLAAVSPDYIEQTGLFLKKLATTANIPILLVTQQHAFIDHTTITYAASEQVVEGEQPRFEVRRLRGAAA